MRRAASIIIAILGSCSDEGDFNPDVYIPRLVYPDHITLDKGSSTTFTVMLDDTMDANGVFSSTNDDVTVSPDGFDLTPSNPSEMFTMTAAVDTMWLDETFIMALYVPGAIGGESPGMDVDVIDARAPHITPDTTDLTVAVLTSTTFGVQLSQPPMAPVTVSLGGEYLVLNFITVAPTVLVFEPDQYDVPQMVTVTDQVANTTGAARISLTSPTAEPAEVLVTVTH
jgi:hypothetical protein